MSETPHSSDHWASYSNPDRTYWHTSGAITYLTKNALSINEGGTPVNFHIRWRPYVGIYLYLFGLRLHTFWINDLLRKIKGL